MKVVWTERALARLQQLHDYIARDQPINARRVIQRLLDREAQLAAHPRSGRTVPEYDDPDVRELIDVPFRIVYRVEAASVRVLTVRHSTEMLPERWSEL
jgi:plasmid stabilization system protein ParE